MLRQASDLSDKMQLHSHMRRVCSTSQPYGLCCCLSAKHSGVRRKQSIFRREKFGVHFNQSLDNVALPPTLTHLKFGNRFNQSLVNVTLPPTLTYLEFEYDFNQSLDDVTRCRKR